MADTEQNGQAAQAEQTGQTEQAGQAGTEAAPAFTQGATTSVGENTQAEQQVLEGQAAPAQAQRGFDMTNIFIWILAALWIWYFFGSKKRRQAKAYERKERERRNAMQKGDQVVTIGRMHGTVVAFTDTTVTIKPDAKSDYTMIFDRQAIYRVLPRPGEEEEQAAAQQ